MLIHVNLENKSQIFYIFMIRISTTQNALYSFIKNNDHAQFL
ncbi:hypothetical protein SAMN04488541_103841 [Thermoflexibacter ruber]|uniref:Uncharacterized protein n=1 Tax=Thermoflexibacter ruber TaxID=1003 RepID=A0A1I2J1K1_9BACT|nr:hypothetical protein SAMN04488541_103841 [Thermoflexibacter ruber]